MVGIVVALMLAAAGSTPRAIEIRGEVVDERGAALAGVTVYAVDAREGTIAERVESSGQGEFVVAVPRGRRYRIEAEGSAWALGHIEKVPPGRVRLVMTRQPGPAPTGRAELTVVGTGTPSGRPAGETVAGRVVDETGAGIHGVRLSIGDLGGRTVAVVDTAGNGGFSTSLAPGRYALLTFAPGLRLQTVELIGPNRWQLTLGIAAAAETVRIQTPAGDPDNPDARERARLTFEGKMVSGQPRVTPTLADLQAARTGVPTSRSHPVALQPLGSYCVRSSECSGVTGDVVCCTSEGQVADEYLWAGGAAGTCKSIRECPGARKYQRPGR
jgi:hypothetical protein